MRIAIIPAFEPDDQLSIVAEEAFQAGFKVIIVDDGSGATFSKFFQKCNQYAHIIRYDENKGKGHALKTAFSYLFHEYQNALMTIVTLDCDGQHKIYDAIRVCEVSENNPGALVLGSRKQSKASPWKSRIGNLLTKLIFRLSTGAKIEDTQTGLRAINGSLLPFLLDIQGERYEYEMNMLLHCASQSFEMVEVPIETVYIHNNTGTHFRALRDSISIYTEILKFTASSFIGFLVDYLIFSLILIFTAGTGVVFANIAARLFSASINFTLNYKVVFRSQESLSRSLLKYFVLACSILVCNTLLLFLLTNVYGLNPFSSKIIVEVILFIGSWMVQRTFVFVKGKEIEKNA